MAAKKQERFAEVKQVGVEIVGLVGECQKLFQATEDSVHWHSYLDFIEQIIIAGNNPTEDDIYTRRNFILIF
jgi:hypothetical protein